MSRGRLSSAFTATPTGLLTVHTDSRILCLYETHSTNTRVVLGDWYISIGNVDTGHASALNIK